jgi:uncharacterized repeat protein (TIGR02543 family)
LSKNKNGELLMIKQFPNNLLSINGQELLGSFSRYASINSVINYNSNLVVGFNSGKIVSYDGSWNGSGPKDDGYAIGPQELIKILSFQGNLVAVGKYNHIASFDGTNWVNFKGSGSGTGINYDGDSNFSIITSVVVYNNTIVFGNWKGEIYSYDGSDWKWPDGTGSGSGIFSDGKQNRFESITSMRVSGANLIVASENGRISSYDGSDWKYFDGYGLGNSLFNDGTALDGQINSIINFNGHTLFLGEDGKIASHDGTTFHTYNETYSYCRDADGDSILSSFVYGSNLYVGFSSGKVLEYTADLTSSNEIIPQDNKPVVELLDYNSDLIISKENNQNDDNNEIYRYNGTLMNPSSVETDVEQYLKEGLIESTIAGAVKHNDKIVIVSEQGEISYFDLTTNNFFSYEETHEFRQTGLYTISSFDLKPLLFQEYILFPSNGGKMSSYKNIDGSSPYWSFGDGKDNYNAPAQGPFSTGAAVIDQKITAVAIDFNQIFLMGDAGAIGRIYFDGSSWVEENIDSGSFMRNQKILSAVVFKNQLWVSNQLGDLKTFDIMPDGIEYTGINNKSVLGSRIVMSMISYNGKKRDFLIFGCDNGFVTSLSESGGFEHIKGIPSFYNSGAAVNFQDITDMIMYSNDYTDILLVAGQNGYIGSYDLTYWEHWDGSGYGTGPYSDGGWLGMGTYNDGASFAWKNIKSFIVNENENLIYMVTENEVVVTFNYKNQEWLDYKGNIILPNRLVAFDSDDSGTFESLMANNFYATEASFYSTEDTAKQERLDADLLFVKSDRLLGTNADFNNIVDDLVFPEKTPRGVFGSTVTIDTSGSPYIDQSGKVIRPTQAEGDHTFSLPLNLSFLKKSLDSTIDGVILYPRTDEECVREDIKHLSLPSVLTDNIVLPSNGNHGTTITWDTSNHVSINSDGTIIRPRYLNTDTLGYVIASVEKNGFIAEKDFEIVVKKFTLDEALSFDMSLIEAALPTSTDSAISLPTVGYNDSLISWNTGSHPNINQDGSIISLLVGESNVVDNIYATIELDGKVVEKEFIITVTPDLSDDSLVNRVANELEIGYQSLNGREYITKDIILPTSTPLDPAITISWDASAHDGINNDGTIIRSLIGGEPKVGSISATVSKPGADSVVKVFDKLFVKPELSDQDSVLYDSETIILKELYDIGEKIYFPAEGPNNTTVTWNKNIDILDVNDVIIEPNKNLSSYSKDITGIVEKNGFKKTINRKINLRVGWQPIDYSYTESVDASFLAIDNSLYESLVDKHRNIYVRNDSSVLVYDSTLETWSTFNGLPINLENRIKDSMCYFEPEEKVYIVSDGGKVSYYDTLNHSMVNLPDLPALPISGFLNISKGSGKLIFSFSDNYDYKEYTYVDPDWVSSESKTVINRVSKSIDDVQQSYTEVKEDDNYLYIQMYHPNYSTKLKIYDKNSFDLVFERENMNRVRGPMFDIDQNKLVIVDRQGVTDYLIDIYEVGSWVLLSSFTKNEFSSYDIHNVSFSDNLVGISTNRDNSPSPQSYKSYILDITTEELVFTDNIIDPYSYRILVLDKNYFIEVEYIDSTFAQHSGKVTVYDINSFQEIKTLYSENPQANQYFGRFHKFISDHELLLSTDYTDSPGSCYISKYNILTEEITNFIDNIKNIYYSANGINNEYIMSGDILYLLGDGGYKEVQKLPAFHRESGFEQINPFLSKFNNEIIYIDYQSSNSINFYKTDVFNISIINQNLKTDNDLYSFSGKVLKNYDESILYNFDDIVHCDNLSVFTLESVDFIKVDDIENKKLKIYKINGSMLSTVDEIFIDSILNYNMNISNNAVTFSFFNEKDDIITYEFNGEYFRLLDPVELLLKPENPTLYKAYNFEYLFYFNKYFEKLEVKTKVDNNWETISNSSPTGIYTSEPDYVTFLNKYKDVEFYDIKFYDKLYISYYENSIINIDCYENNEITSVDHLVFDNVNLVKFLDNKKLLIKKDVYYIYDINTSTLTEINNQIDLEVYKNVQLIEKNDETILLSYSNELHKNKISKISNNNFFKIVGNYPVYKSDKITVPPGVYTSPTTQFGRNVLCSDKYIFTNVSGVYYPESNKRSGAYDGYVLVYDKNTKAFVTKLSATNIRANQSQLRYYGYNMAINSKYLFVAFEYSDFNRVDIYDVETLEKVHMIESINAEESVWTKTPIFFGAGICANDNYLVIASSYGDGRFDIYDANSWNKITTISGPQNFGFDRNIFVQISDTHIVATSANYQGYWNSSVMNGFFTIGVGTWNSSLKLKNFDNKRISSLLINDKLFYGFQGGIDCLNLTNDVTTQMDINSGAFFPESPLNYSATGATKSNDYIIFHFSQSYKSKIIFYDINTLEYKFSVNVVNNPYSMSLIDETVYLSEAFYYGSGDRFIDTYNIEPETSYNFLEQYPEIKIQKKSDDSIYIAGINLSDELVIEQFNDQTGNFSELTKFPVHHDTEFDFFFNSLDELIVAYHQPVHNGVDIFVSKFSGTEWENIGAKQSVSNAENPDNTIYLQISESSSGIMHLLAGGSKLSAFRFNGLYWETIDERSFNENHVFSKDVNLIMGNNDKVFASWYDNQNGSPQIWESIANNISDTPTQLIALFNTEKTQEDYKSVQINFKDNRDCYINVDWGDGTVEEFFSTWDFNENSDTTLYHEYSTPGIYEVKIIGDVPTINDLGGTKSPSSEINTLEEIRSWGSVPIDSRLLNNILRYDITISTTETPVFSNNSLDYAFRYVDGINPVVDSWDISSVTSMRYAFDSAINIDIDLSSWNTSNVTNMSYMFSGCTSFNQDLSAWDVSNVTDMSGMFYGCTSFNQDLSTWNVSNVTNMYKILQFCTSFNQDLSAWNVSNVTDMSGMFYGCTSFNQDLSTWNVSNVTDMSRMFSSCTSFNGDISSWNVSNVTNMSGMFYGCTSFNQDLSAWDVSSVTDMSQMFRESSFNQDLSAWNTSNVTNMSYMFYECTSFNQDLSAWDVSNVTDMSQMFRESSFNQDLSAWNTSNVTDMSYMFYECTLFNQDLSTWNVSNVTDMSYMFYQCTSFNQNLNAWNVEHLSEPSQFGGSYYWKNVDKPLWGIAQSLKIEITIDLNYSGLTKTLVRQSGILLNHDNLLVIRDGYVFNGWQKDGFDFNPYNNVISENTTLTAQWLAATADFSFMVEVTDNYTVTVDKYLGVMNCDVDWGDGVIEAATNDISHTYTEPGYYVVKLIGQYDSIRIVGAAFYAVLSWGTNQWTSFRQMFSSTNLKHITNHESPDTSNVTDMSYMFYGCTLFNSDISSWDVSNVTDMYQMFYGCTLFNGDISTWDVSNVTDMSYMFYQCTSFNGDISSWNVSSVTDMYQMFYGCTSFNQDLSTWDVSNVNYMSSMFSSCTSFNQDLSTWDVSNVNYMSSMFSSCTSFNQDLSTWNTSNVTNMSYMFSGCTSFNQDLSTWNTANVTNMSSMFYGCTSFNQNIGFFDISNVTSMYRILDGVQLSTSNYDATLNGWANISGDETSIPSNINLGNINSNYSSAGQSARNILTTTYNWSISDQGII